jgi:CDP-glycerol glycerophosphotransferase (TagB/SpsB family)
MKTISFCVEENGTGKYSMIVDSFISQIIPHLEDYVYDIPRKGRVNVCFFHGDRKKKGKVFISHGIADKNWRDAKKVKGFDYVFVSGPLWVDKLTRQRLPGDKIIVAGYAKLDPIFRGEIKRRPGDKKRILWAPTHGAIRSVSSCYRMEQYLTRLPDDMELCISYHPANKKDKNITMQLLADADVVIGDSGSIAYEAMAMGKPVVYPDWLVKQGILAAFKGSFEEEIFQRGIGFHAAGPGDLIRTLRHAIESGIDDKTKNFIDGIFPPYLRGTSGKATADALRRIALL